MDTDVREKVIALRAIVESQDARIATLEEKLDYFKRKLENLMTSVRNGAPGLIRNDSDIG